MLLIDQIKVPGIYLFMNFMRDRAESIRAVGPYPSVEEAIKAHDNALLSEPTIDSEGYVHAFKEDSPFFWLNPLEDQELAGKIGVFGHGIVEAYETKSIAFAVTVR